MKYHVVRAQCPILQLFSELHINHNYVKAFILEGKKVTDELFSFLGHSLTAWRHEKLEKCWEHEFNMILL